MDPIANFLTQIRNGYGANKKSVSIPHSKIKESIAKILSDSGYVGKVEVVGAVPAKKLDIELIYDKKTPVVTHISRISRPSVRYYSTAAKIPYALSGKGLSILSTSKGLMTDRAARKAGIGGELICQIW